MLNFMHDHKKGGLTDLATNDDPSKKYQSSGRIDLDNFTSKLKLSDARLSDGNFDDFINNYKDPSPRELDSLSLRNLDSNALVLPMAKSVIMLGDVNLQRTDRLKAQKSHMVLDPYSRN